MILKNRNIKSFFLSNVLDVVPLILLLSLLLTLLPTHVQAAGASAVQEGNGAAATGNSSVAIGFQAQTDSFSSVIIGYDAGTIPFGNGSVGIGTDADPRGDNSLAIGARAAWHGAQSYGEFSSAVGGGARANADTATSIGYGAFADHEGAVAIGAHSQSHQDYTVSVGSGDAADAATYQYRRITNVGTPVHGHDVATKEYVDNHHHIVGHQFDNIERRVNNLGAMQVSIANAQVQMPSNKHTAIGVGVGAYRGSSAATVGLTHRIPGRLAGLRFTGNLTVANAGEKEGGVGIGYSF